MIDVSKIKVGDEVTVRHVVRRVDDNDKSLPIFIYAKSWVAREEIATHTPKPREFKPGDRVTWGNGSRVYEFLAQRGTAAIVWDAEYGPTDPNISSLRHADESE